MRAAFLRFLKEASVFFSWQWSFWVECGRFMRVWFSRPSLKCTLNTCVRVTCYRQKTQGSRTSEPCGNVVINVLWHIGRAWLCTRAKGLLGVMWACSGFITRSSVVLFEPPYLCVHTQASLSVSHCWTLYRLHSWPNDQVASVACLSVSLFLVTIIYPFPGDFHRLLNACQMQYI